MIVRRKVAGEDVRLCVLPRTNRAAAEAWAAFVASDPILGLDVESTAFGVLGPFDPSIKTRLIQFGNYTEAWVIDVNSYEWRPRVETLLGSAEHRFVSHNASFDTTRVLYEYGVDLNAEGRSIDTLPMACLRWPGITRPHDLKSLSTHYIDGQLAEAEDMLHARFMDLFTAQKPRTTRLLPHSFVPGVSPCRRPRGKAAEKCSEPSWVGSLTGYCEKHWLERKLTAEANTWGWSNIALDDPFFTSYAGLDAIYVRRLLDSLGEELRARGMARLSRTEQRVKRQMTSVSFKGHRVDVEWTREILSEVEAEFNEAEGNVEMMTGVKARSPKLKNWFIDQGVRVTSLDKDHVEALVADHGGLMAGESVVSDVLANLEVVSKHSNLLSNLRTIMAHAIEGDGYVHPNINTLQAHTGRMCLPDSHRLLTKRGVLTPDEIRTGDLTLDLNGLWTSVTAVHRYADQQIERRLLRSGDTLEATAEHRWVLSREEHPERVVEPFPVARRRVHLAPEGTFDFTSVEAPTSFAALVGWLVSDGRLHDGGPGVGLRAYVYQTEGKFLEQARAAIPPEALMYDRVTTNGVGHHELRIKARWLRPRLEAAGLTVDPLLRTSESLPGWVMRLDLAGVEDFFRAVWLADGSTSHPQNQHISVDSEPLTMALQIAAYRLGLRSRRTVEAPGGWSTKPRTGLKFLRQVPSTRDSTVVKDRADVWCVSTASGTFTAWKGGPYLTGNSVTGPAMQTLAKKGEKGHRLRGCFIARDGHVLIGADYDSQEIRIGAAVSQDEALLEVIRTGKSQHVITAESIWAGEFIDKVQNPDLYTYAKNLDFAQQYGAMPKKIALMIGCSEREAVVLWGKWRRTYRGLVKWSEREAKKPYIVNPYGRVIPRDEYRAYASGNYYIQSTGRDLLGEAMCRLEDAGWAPYFWLPIHDELVMEVPEDRAEEGCAALTELMTTTVLGMEVPAEGEVIGTRWAGLG